MREGLTTVITGRFDSYTGRPVVITTLIYRRERPWEVTARFGDTTWVFARDLLVFGLLAPEGQGDVYVTPRADHVRIELDNGTADWAAIHLPIREVAAFVAATTRVVALGAESEHTDLDALVGDLLGRAA